ncbi:hypothetical protein BC943DRAFT_61347 [Umbelopsis sp. AD052]|nr:hypothetical protein BC943DRAFT_61347 [Umbelopsis sp. AD052]
MYIEKSLLQFVYSVAGVALSIIFAALLLLLNMKYGDHDFRYFSKNKTVSDFASPSFLRTLAKKRKTQGIMVYALVCYIMGLLFVQYIPTLLSISETLDLERKSVYNTTVLQSPTPYWTSLEAAGMQGNSDPTPLQTQLLYDLFHQLDPINQLNNMSFDQSHVTYTPLTGSHIGEFTEATDYEVNLWKNYTNVQPHLTNATMTLTGVTYSNNWTITNYAYTTDGDWSFFLYRPDLYYSWLQPLRPPSELFEPAYKSLVWTNEIAGSWSMPNSSYLWSSLSYGVIQSPQLNNNFSFYTNLADLGDNGTGICVEQSHISSLLAAVPVTQSTNSAYMQWNNSDSVCELRAVVYVDGTFTTLMLGASKTKVARADFSYADWVAPIQLGRNSNSPPSPMGQLLNNIAGTDRFKVPNNLLISADSYLLDPSSDMGLVNVTATQILLRSRLVDPAKNSPGRDALFLTSVVSNHSLAIPMTVTYNIEAIDSPVWVPILAGALVVIAISLILFRKKISGDWDLDLYLLFIDTADVHGEFGEHVAEVEKHLEVLYDPDSGRSYLTTPKAMVADTILENVISDDKRELAEDLMDKYSSLDGSVKQAPKFLLDSYTTADLKKAVAKIKKAKHTLTAKKSHLKILDAVAQNCAITKELSKKGIDVTGLWDLLQEVDFAKVISLTQKAALSQTVITVPEIQHIV